MKLVLGTLDLPLSWILNNMNTFYQTHFLDLNTKRDMCFKAKDLCFKWWVDKLDCSESFLRQIIEMPFEEIMNKLDDRSHFSVIYRKNFNEDYLEVGFRTLSYTNIVEQIDYFLWILIDNDKSKEFLNLFNLEPVS